MTSSMQKYFPKDFFASCDIETVCGVKECEHHGKSDCKHDHQLHHKHNKIAVLGVYDGKKYINFGSDVRSFNKWKTRTRARLGYHRGKFDTKTLIEKGAKLSARDFAHDSLLMGACVNRKVTEEYLERYNAKRAELNARLPKGQKHRYVTQYSLKVMAPFYLKVAPFWENTETHDDEEYNKLDCIYTYDLIAHLFKEMKFDGTLPFYTNYLMPWQKLAVQAELEGVLVDEDKLHEMYAEAKKELAKYEEEVHQHTRPALKKFQEAKIKELRKDAYARLDKALERLKNPAKKQGCIDRYRESFIAKCKNEKHVPKRFNLASPTQMLYILEWAGIDTSIEKRDKESNEWIEGEGTNKFVLKRAKVCDKNKFAAILLKYREKETEVQYLKQYIDACVDGRIYCTFNLTGTRTGRLSSSGPNLQNVKGALRIPFIVADPDKYSIYTVDSSQIEPRLIAYLTCDKTMVKLFQDGRDYHNYATHLMFPETRKVPEADIKKKYPHLRNDVAKHADLSSIYGTGAFTLKNMVLVRGEKDVSMEFCEDCIDELRAGMKGVMGWKRGLEDHYKEGGKIFNSFGFPVTARSKKSVHMTLFNSYVQGQASQMIFNASLLAFRHFAKKGIDAIPLMWVHDEVVWRLPKGKEEYCKKIIDKYMTAYKLETPYGKVPLACEGKIADRWQK